MPRTLTGRVIVITGASSGIGAATAIACAQHGMNVVLSARRGDRLDEVAASVRALGREAVTLAGDVTDPGLSDRLLDAAREEFGRFDVVLANAGYAMHRPMYRKSEDELRQMFDVNFFAPMHLLRRAATRLVDMRQPGHLLMTSSCVSKFALPYQGAYAATKAAQNAVCSAMRLEHREHDIYVSSVHPITTTTEFFRVSAETSGRPVPNPGESPAHAPKFFTQSPERVARAIVRCLKRPCPEVWTSHIVRTVAGLATVFPRFGDFVIRRQTAAENAASIPTRVTPPLHDDAPARPAAPESVTPTGT